MLGAREEWRTCSAISFWRLWTWEVSNGGGAATLSAFAPPPGPSPKAASKMSSSFWKAMLISRLVSSRFSSRHLLTLQATAPSANRQPPPSAGLCPNRQYGCQSVSSILIPVCQVLVLVHQLGVLVCQLLHQTHPACTVATHLKRTNCGKASQGMPAALGGQEQRNSSARSIHTHKKQPWSSP